MNIVDKFLESGHALAQRQILSALNTPQHGRQPKHVYAGTVSFREIQRRRRKGKAAKAARKLNRGR